MYNEKECPVCGCKNEETRYYEEIWGASEVVESYYHCTRCSYFDETVYGKHIEGILASQSEKYANQIAKLGLTVYNKKPKI